jgi:dihydrolipoamide dehydrogenase
MMKKYDEIVIGGCSGSTIAQQALMHGANGAMINKQQIGSTCQNFGFIPSKMLIYPAGIIAMLYEEKKLGVDTEIINIHFKVIMNRVRTTRKDSQDHQKKGLDQVDNFNYYLREADFVDMDLLDTEEKKELMKEVNKCNPKLIYPTLKIDNECILGFKKDEIKEALK